MSFPSATTQATTDSAVSLPKPDIMLIRVDDMVITQSKKPAAGQMPGM